VIGAVALVAQVVLAWIGSELFELDGLAVALALSTGVVLVALLHVLGALDTGVRGIARAAAVVAVLTAVAYLPVGLLLGTVTAALVGSLVYVTLVALWRPRRLTESWGYLRALR